MDNPATDLLLDILNDASGAVINLDPDGKQKLANLRGKIFCLEVIASPATQPTKRPIKLYLVPTERGLEWRRDVEAPPDVTLRGSPLAFARLGRGFLSGDATRSATASHSSADRLTIHGDAELAQALQKILGQLDLDWEELLARYVGDMAARSLGNAARGLAGWAEKSFHLSRENIADYLREEKRILVTVAAMERFGNTLNRTRANVDRLSQRVERLKRALE